ncbi:MAG: 16S rRNA (uracil(1498)-N(3))-methyltransferase [Lachnospiraceae bacterium]|nr:16S rRNA (uracil(1498)-N(3))-methyltransferase [Lachnospiraceae bacterium]
MHHFFVKPEQIAEGMVRITGPDVNHAKNVLRMKPGEELLVSDGTGQDYLCRVAELDSEAVLAEILKKEEDSRELPSRIILYQGLPKSDKMELIIQKAVELGVSRIVPVATKNAVVKLDKKKEESKLKRWQSIAESAAKQSKRSVIPEISGVLTLKEAVKDASVCGTGFFAYEHQEGMAGTAKELAGVGAGQSIAVFIGPEGGFEPEEVQMAEEAGIRPVSLGKRILRTETAGLTLLSVLMMKLELEAAEKISNPGAKAGERQEL